MSYSVILQFIVADREMGIGRMIRIGDQFPPQLQGAHVRRILIANPVRGESLVQDSKREVTHVFRSVTNLEGIFAPLTSGFEAQVLHKD